MPCGVTAPGLEVVLDHPGEILTPAAGAELLSTDYSGIELSYDEVVRRWGKDKLWHPALDRGDVMVFSHLTVHRTYQTAAMTQPRISLEMRCGDGKSPRLRAARQDLLDVKVARTTASRRDDAVLQVLGGSALSADAIIPLMLADAASLSASPALGGVLSARS